ncbi:hypothetical protein [Microcystis phage Mel-JY33]
MSVIDLTKYPSYVKQLLELGEDEAVRRRFRDVSHGPDSGAMWQRLNEGGEWSTLLGWETTAPPVHDAVPAHGVAFTARFKADDWASPRYIEARFSILTGPRCIAVYDLLAGRAVR